MRSSTSRMSCLPEELDKVLMSAGFDVGLSAKAKGVLLWYGTGDNACRR